MNKEELKLKFQRENIDYFIEELPENFNKPIAFVLQGDGLWQVRRNQIGTGFLHMYKEKIPGLKSPLVEGWDLAVPLIPFESFTKAVAFFRSVYKKHKSEAFIQFLYDPEAQAYSIHCPKQTVSGGSVKYTRDKEDEKGIFVLEMHSHGNMDAFFSTIDDADEEEDRFFGVVGNVDEYMPTAKFRASIGGKWLEMEIDDIFDTSLLKNDFPQKWLKNIKKEKVISLGRYTGFPGHQGKFMPYNRAPYQPKHGWLQQEIYPHEKGKSIVDAGPKRKREKKPQEATDPFLHERAFYGFEELLDEEELQKAQTKSGVVKEDNCFNEKEWASWYMADDDDDDDDDEAMLPHWSSYQGDKK